MDEGFYAKRTSSAVHKWLSLTFTGQEIYSPCCMCGRGEEVPSTKCNIMDCDGDNMGEGLHRDYLKN